MEHHADWSVKLESIMRLAGELLLSFRGKQLKRSYKQDKQLVTEADIVSEQFLIHELGTLLPEASFCAEESGNNGDGPYCWVIDPLDGTTNFAQGLPYFGISVALTYQGVPQVGAVYMPLFDEFFYAERAQGAWCNGEPIRVSDVQDHTESVVAIGLPYGYDERVALLHAVEQVARSVRAIRHLGAVAVDLAYASSGRFDGVALAGLAWWDVAAGMLLIQEAGGKVTDFAGNAVHADYSSCIAGNVAVHRHLQKLFAKV